MPARARLVRSGAAVAFVGLLLSGCAAQVETSGAETAPEGSGFVAGDGSIVVLDEADRAPAPDLVGETLDGGQFRLADHRGEVVVLNVWASWCAPCRAEAPVLAQVADDLADDGVLFVGLDTRDSDAAARGFVDRFDIEYPNVIDRDGRLQLLFADSLPPQAIPSTVVIDRQGRVAGRILGKASESTLLALIEPLVAEPAPES